MDGGVLVALGGVLVASGGVLVGGEAPGVGGWRGGEYGGCWSVVLVGSWVSSVSYEQDHPPRIAKRSGAKIGSTSFLRYLRPEGWAGGEVGRWGGGPVGRWVGELDGVKVKALCVRSTYAAASWSTLMVVAAGAGAEALGATKMARPIFQCRFAAEV